MPSAGGLSPSSTCEREGGEKERFNELAKKLTELSTKFSNNVLDCTKAYAYLIVDKKEVAGLPATALAAMAQGAREKKVFQCPTMMIYQYLFTQKW